MRDQQLGAFDVALLERHFGGQETYFHCPVCDRRRKTVYWRWSRWACRSCQQLTYRSCQRSHEYDRKGIIAGIDFARFDHLMNAHIRLRNAKTARAKRRAIARAAKLL